MNFTNFLPFTSTALSVNNASVPQLSTAKFANATAAPSSGQVVAVLNSDDNGVAYFRPLDTNGFALNLGGALNNQQHNQIITLPITIPSKPGEQQQTIQIQVVNPNSNSDKMVPLSLPVIHLAYNHQNQEGIQLQLQQAGINAELGSDQTNHSDSDNNSSQMVEQQTINNDNTNMQDVKPTMAELAQHQEQHASSSTNSYPVTVVVPPEMILRHSLGDHVLDPGGKGADEEKEKECMREAGMNPWQATAVTPSVAEYLSQLPADSLSLPLHHFLKFSNDTIKRESGVESSPLSNADGIEGHILEMNPADPDQLKGKKKKKYKKKPPKPRRPRPGQVHIATALDGTLLFCCPECNMAYPDKEMLEQHLVAHKIDRRYICDICGAGLKRKEHLERHKLGHNPERPFVCEVCTKGFKRKEHLNLHAVIHSGEKTEICQECGKGFYRRDHLRKHTKSHIAKRMREELHAQQQQLHRLQEQQQQQHNTILIAATGGGGGGGGGTVQENGDHRNALIIHSNSTAEHDRSTLIQNHVSEGLEGTVILAGGSNENGANLLLQRHVQHAAQNEQQRRQQQQQQQQQPVVTQSQQMHHQQIQHQPVQSPKVDEQIGQQQHASPNQCVMKLES